MDPIRVISQVFFLIGVINYPNWECLTSQACTCSHGAWVLGYTMFACSHLLSCLEIPVGASCTLTY